MAPKLPEGFTPVLSPVQRLAALLLRGVTEQGLFGQQTGVALCLLVGLQPTADRRNWSRAYLDIQNLLDESRQYVSSVVESFDDSPHGGTFHEVLAVFNQMTLEHQWNTYVQPLTHLAKIALPFVVHATDGTGQPPLLQTDLLTGLRQDLDRLLQRVLESTLPPEFKEEFARSITELRDAIIRIHVYGPQGVARAAALVVGSIATNEAAVKKDHPVVREAAETVLKVQDVFLKAVKIGKIAAPLLKLLAPGS